MTRLIDLRSDTVTRPTAAMRAAMADAEVGDEQYREDPTVIELERRVAALIGHEAAVFMPSATMANQVALMLFLRPGEQLLAAQGSHLLRYEVGGPAVHARAMATEIPTASGLFSAEDLARAVTPRGSMHEPETALVSIENTHNGAGGAVWPLVLLREVVDAARAANLRVHLDGARLWNASVAHGVSLAEYGACADSVTLCFSKGLGCPAGAVLAVADAHAGTARRLKQLMGGGMRQSGVLAAAALVALDQHIGRLAEDHARGRRFEQRLAGHGVDIVPAPGETNFVLLDAQRVGISSGALLEALAERGVLVSRTARHHVLRAVTHLDVGDDDVEAAADAVADAVSCSARDRRDR